MAKPTEMDGYKVTGAACLLGMETDELSELLENRGKQGDLEQLVSPGELVDFLGISKRTLYRLRARNPDFPRPFQMSPKLIRFSMPEVMVFLENTQDQEEPYSTVESEAITLLSELYDNACDREETESEDGEEFLPYMLLPSGQTVYEEIHENLTKTLDEGSPTLLLGPYTGG